MNYLFYICYLAATSFKSDPDPKKDYSWAALNISITIIFYITSFDMIFITDLIDGRWLFGGQIIAFIGLLIGTRYYFGRNNKAQGVIFSLSKKREKLRNIDLFVCALLNLIGILAIAFADDIRHLFTGS
jgi:hypothetical protein